MFKEFKEFIAKGNMLDLAVGIIIGAAFGAVVNSMVADMITPLIGLVGGANFENLFFVLKDGTGGQFQTVAEAQKSGAVTLNYGLFFNALFNFLIVGLMLFIVVRAANRLRKRQEEEPKVIETPQDVILLSEIRDLLRAR